MSKSKDRVYMDWNGCPRLLDYYRLPRESKEKYLQTEEAKCLLERLPVEIKNVLMEGFLSGVQGCDIQGWDKVLEYFLTNSSFIREVAENPGTFSMPDKMYYLSMGLEGYIDNYFMRCMGGGQALKNRFDAVINYSVEFLGNLHGDGLVLNLGSGSGRDTVTMCLKEPSLCRFSIHCLDIDPAAINAGRNLSESHGLSNIRFFQESFIGLGNRYPATADYGLIIGILCGLDSVLCVKILRAVRPYFKKGAQIIAARLTDEMLKEDMLTAYIAKETTGWILRYPSPGDLKAVFERAGYKWGGSFSDEPTRFYEIGIGIV